MYFKVYIISTVQMAYTPNEHPTTDKQLVVLRGKCPFHMFIKSKPGKYGIKLWFAADARIFMPATCKSGGVGGKKQGLRVVKDMVCHMYGTGTRVTTDNLCTKFFLSKNMTVVGTLRKNTSEIPALFLSGKQCPFFHL